MGGLTTPLDLLDKGLDFLVPGVGGGGASGPTLTRLSSGLLAIRTADAFDGPDFDESEFDDYTGATSSVTTGSTALPDDIGSLKVTVPSGSSGAAFTALAARAEMLVQARAGVTNSTSVYLGLGLHGGTPATQNFKLLRKQFDSSGVTMVQQEKVDGSNTNFNNDGSGNTKNDDTWYDFAVWADGDDFEVYSFDDDIRLTTDLASLTSGYAVFGGSSGVDAYFQQVYIQASKIITVNSLESGYKAKVLDDSDTILASAVEDGTGIAELDVEDAWMADAAHLIVTDGSDAEQYRASPSDGPWGGDEYDIS